MWIVVTLFATVMQTARTALQQRLRSIMSVSAAGFVRYAYGAPLALVALGLTFTVFGQAVPAVPARFWLTVTVAGLAQILGTIALITAFDRRDFAIGTVYAKSEVIQVAVFSAVVLRESLTPLGWLAALVCVGGVVALAKPAAAPLRRLLRFGDGAAWYGLAAGGLFALAAVFIRLSSRSLGDGPAVVRALFTLAAMNTIQSVVNGIYLARTNRAQFVAVFSFWRSSAIVGVLSVLGSAGWALAVTLENAAKVRTLGQVELLLTFAVSHRLLGERHKRREVVASAVVMLGVLGVMLAG